MELKINKYKLQIILIMVAICQFFAVLRIGNYIYKSDLINLSVILLSITFIVINKFKPVIQMKKNEIAKYIVAYLLIYFIEVIYSTYRYSTYGQNFIHTIACSISEISIIVFVPLLFLQEKVEDKDYLKKIIKLFGLIAAILSIIQVFLYNFNIVILDISYSGIRYNSLRFGIAGYLISISLIITLCDFLNNFKIKDLIIFLIECIFFLYASKTRSEMMYIIFAIGFSILFFYKNTKIKRLFIFLGIFSIILIVFSGFGKNFINNLLHDDGFNIRFKTINFYMNQLYENPILGMGYIKQHVNPYLTFLLFGDAGYYYRDDVGIIGLMNEKGIAGLILYILFLIKILKMTISLYKKDKKEYLFMIMISVYFLLCSINLIYFNPLRIATAFVVFSMISNYYNKEFSNDTRS